MIAFARGPGGSIMSFFFLINLSALSGAYRYNRKEYRNQGNHRTEYLIRGYAHVRSNVCEDGGFKGIFLHNDSPIRIKEYEIFSDFYMKRNLFRGDV
jgi:hypothetical protein